MSTTARGFAVPEFRQRLGRAQAAMREAGIDAFLLTSRHDIGYFCGVYPASDPANCHGSFLLVPGYGEPVAIVAARQLRWMRDSWIEDIRDWCPSHGGERSIDLLVAAIGECVSPSGCVAVPMEDASRAQLSAVVHRRIVEGIKPIRMREDAGIMWKLRAVKSESEIAKIAHACSVGARGLAKAGEIDHARLNAESLLREMQILLLRDGADQVPLLHLTIGANATGVEMSSVATTHLPRGQVLQYRAGIVWDRYFGVLDRSVSAGPANAQILSAHARQLDALEAGMEAARTGRSLSEIRDTALEYLPESEEQKMDTGAVFSMHGLGLQMGEMPFLDMPDPEPVCEGMVLRLVATTQIDKETSLSNSLVVAIRGGRAELLAPFADRSIPQI